jgi:endonuclease YncB( thermonuclease family)
MPPFKVKKVLDGNQFEVLYEWAWENRCGNRVRIHGCQAPRLEEIGGEEARRRLAAILLETSVELTTAYGFQEDALVCDVYLRGQNLANLFPEHRG